MSPPGRRHGRGAGQHKSGGTMHGRRVKRAGMDGTRHRNSDHKDQHRISVRTDSRRSSCGCGANLRKLGLNGVFSKSATADVQRLKFCWLAMDAVCRISTLGKNLLAGDVRSAPLYFYTASRPHEGRRQVRNFSSGDVRRAQLYFLYSKRGSRCMAENFYQLALRTPGIWPLYASSRKQIRQMP